MTSSERKVLLDALALNYLIEKENSRVWQREKSSSYSKAQGELQGACMALNLDFEEQDGTLTIYTRNRRKIVAKVDLSQ
ncbi:hypothetical protein [Brevibacillus daliensis]|uniref:hypothetical protein n=1 Tax=Brevibacillus daliensis TaxID=2892995 RepID=UPI001E6319F5|nr:hypothetical protein [Brevibacillus daliensis]